ncbi:MAG: MurR/RpiR family transcriptional regulator [Clostridiales bacterium]|nr:MurR/RpiR family transcriptional regulator [Clostridiales bacterium]
MITERIKEAFPKLRKSEQRAASYILEHVDEMERISLEKLARKADVSQPTVLRMLKAAGYEGFREAKFAFVEERLQRESSETYDILGMELEKNNQIEDVPGKIIRNTIKLLEDSLQAISAKELKKAVRAIEKAEKVCIFSVENSNTTAVDLMTKLLYLGIECEFNEDYYLQSIRAGHMKASDVAIGISYTGTSRNTVDVLKQAKKSGAVTIAITNFMDTPLTKYADIVILTSNKQFLYGNDIFSRTIHLAVVDMLYMGLIIEHYDKYEARLKESGKMIKARKYE